MSQFFGMLAEMYLLPHEALDKTIEQFGIGATELASKAGIDPTELSRYRNGHRDWGSKKLFQVVNCLNLQQRAYFYSLLQSDLPAGECRVG